MSWGNNVKNTMNGANSETSFSLQLEVIGNISTKETATKETKKKQNQRRTLPFHWFYQLYLADVFDDPKKERGEDERSRKSNDFKPKNL